MYAILVLAASLPTVVLDGRLITVNVPANVPLKHQGVNFDTAEYDFYSGTDSAISDSYRRRGRDRTILVRDLAD
jgi:hypothetical protein